MSESQLSREVIKRLSDEFYAADGFFGAFDAIFVETYGKMGVESRALAITQDVPPMFVIAPGLFDGDEDNKSGDCMQYNTPHSCLRMIANEPIGHVRFEIDYIIEVPQPKKRFWAKCSRGSGIMPDTKMIGAYEAVADANELAEAILHDLFVIEIDPAYLK